MKVWRRQSVGLEYLSRVVKLSPGNTNIPRSPDFLWWLTHAVRTAAHFFLMLSKRTVSHSPYQWAQQLESRDYPSESQETEKWVGSLRCYEAVESTQTSNQSRTKGPAICRPRFPGSKIGTTCAKEAHSLSLPLHMCVWLSCTSGFCVACPLPFFFNLKDPSSIMVSSCAKVGHAFSYSECLPPPTHTLGKSNNSQFVTKDCYRT